MSTLYRKDKLIIEVCADRAELGARAGADAADAIRAAINANGEARVVFAAAPSQNETLETLVNAPDIDWTKVVALHMDEYIGLPTGSGARFSYYLKKHLFEKLPFKRIYYIDDQKGDSVEKLLARYSEILAQAPIDVVCMGIGENGHIAFNDPDVADFDDPLPIKVVELDEECRRQQVNDGCFPTFALTLTHAMTLTIPTAGAYRHLPVPGQLKAPSDGPEGPVTTARPASVMRTFSTPRCTSTKTPAVRPRLEEA